MERIFIGIKIPSSYTCMVSQLYSTAIATDKRLKNCKWVSEENLHLTLSFIGEISTDRRLLIQEALREIRFTRFSLKLVNRIETFPERSKNIRVLHLPLVQSSPQDITGKTQWSLQLESLKQSIDEVLTGSRVSSGPEVGSKEEVVLKTMPILVGPSLDEEVTSLQSSMSIPKENISKKRKEKFHPHLTISRVRQHCKVVKVRDLVEQMNKVMNSGDDPLWNEMIFFVEEFLLFRSTLTPHGPIYDVIESYSCEEG